MKKLLLTLALFPLLSIAPVVHAQDTETQTPAPVNTEKENTLPAGETFTGDYFTAGQRNEISGTVNGDVYSAGGQVTFDGKINGDFLVAGGQVSIDGEVTGDVRVAGGTVTISNKVDHNLTVLGGNVEVTSSGTIGGSVVGGVGNLTINGPVSANIRVGSGNLTINNKVGGNVDAAVGMFHLGSKADITGNLTYWSKDKVSMAKGAKVGGKVTKKEPIAVSTNKSFVSLPSAGEIAAAVKGISLFIRIVDFLALLLAGIILIWLFPSLDDRVQETIRKKHWLSLGIGIAGWIAIPIVAIAFLITVIGIPIGLIIGVWYAIVLYFARIFAIIWLGKFVVDLFKWKLGRIITFLFGLIIFWILSLLGIVGVLVNIVAFLFGFGALLIVSRNIYKESRSKNIV
ncbi:MAG TPA: polymer-forming cytoskeletal protein [Candidatus Saccharimonadales bacterium]|nr:polymer-forming cytoskeletal protein [Candidatus Saccharimonadales bacterium]